MLKPLELRQLRAFWINDHKAGNGANLMEHPRRFARERLPEEQLKIAEHFRLQAPHPCPAPRPLAAKGEDREADRRMRRQPSQTLPPLSVLWVAVFQPPRAPLPIAATSRRSATFANREHREPPSGRRTPGICWQ